MKSGGMTKSRGRCVKACAGKDFFVLIFCYFFIKEYGEALLSTLKKQTTAKNVIGLCDYEQTDAHISTTLVNRTNAS